MSTPTTTCPGCRRPVDLTDPAAAVTPTFAAGYGLCPACGEMLLLDRDTAVLAVKARDATAGPPEEGE